MGLDFCTATKMLWPHFMSTTVLVVTSGEGCQAFPARVSFSSRTSPPSAMARAIIVATLLCIVVGATAIVLEPKAGGTRAAPQQRLGDPTLAAGFATYFRSASCPTGWSPVPEAAGRLIVSVSDVSDSGLTLGTPLGDKEDRTHTHGCVRQQLHRCVHMCTCPPCT